MFLLDFQDPVELATVLLITCGIISGAVSTYLGIVKYVLWLATPPCFTAMLTIMLKMTPVPYVTILSAAIFYIYIMSLSVKTHADSLELFKMKFENLELIGILKNSESVLQGLASKDDLTGLPNRRQLFEAFSRIAPESARKGKKLAVLFIDMDNFKTINDRYGHETGDKVLVETGRIMLESLRSSDVVARLGGDEFVAVLMDIGSREGALKVMRKLSANLNTSLTVGPEEIPLGASIGLALFPDQSESLEELLKLSDSEMYSAKTLSRQSE